MPASLLVTHAGFLVQRPRHVMHTHILPPVQLLVTHAGFPVQHPRHVMHTHNEKYSTLVFGLLTFFFSKV